MQQRPAGQPTNRLDQRHFPYCRLGFAVIRCLKATSNLSRERKRLLHRSAYLSDPSSTRQAGSSGGSRLSAAEAAVVLRASDSQNAWHYCAWLTMVLRAHRSSWGQLAAGVESSSLFGDIACCCWIGHVQRCQ